MTKKIDWEEIRSEWETTKITFKALAEKHGVKEGTLKSRRSREQWSRDATKKDATIQKDATENNNKVATEPGAPKGNKNAVGNKGNPNPTPRFTKRNSMARTHGLFADFIHEEQREIIGQMQTLSLADQIWTQIEIKFSAIIRMQKIMWVAYDDDHLKEESGYSQGMDGSSVSYKVVYAHERYESYIRAQARAMAEYRNLIKQYIELTDEFDERRIRLEGMQININRVKAETEKITSGDDDSPIEIRITRAGDG